MQVTIRQQVLLTGVFVCVSKLVV